MGTEGAEGVEGVAAAVEATAEEEEEDVFGTGAAAAGLSADAAEESEVASSSDESAVRRGVRRDAEAIAAKEQKLSSTLGNPEEANHPSKASAQAVLEGSQQAIFESKPRSPQCCSPQQVRALLASWSSWRRA